MEIYLGGDDPKSSFRHPQEICFSPLAVTMNQHAYRLPPALHHPDDRRSRPPRYPLRTSPNTALKPMPELASLGLPILHDSWTANPAEIVACHPDLVIASVPYRMESLAAILKSGLPVLALLLRPHTLADIFKATHPPACGPLTFATGAGENLIATCEAELAATRAVTDALPHPTVYCEEWGKPLIRSQQWVAELVAAAGGQYLGEPGFHTTAEEVAATDPDVPGLCLVRGAGDRVPLARVIEQRNWHHLRAVRNGNVFCVPDEFFNTPAHTLDGRTSLSCGGLASGSFRGSSAGHVRLTAGNCARGLALGCVVPVGNAVKPLTSSLACQ